MFKDFCIKNPFVFISLSVSCLIFFDNFDVIGCFISPGKVHLKLIVVLCKVAGNSYNRA